MNEQLNYEPFDLVHYVRTSFYKWRVRRIGQSIRTGVIEKKKTINTIYLEYKNDFPPHKNQIIKAIKMWPIESREKAKKQVMDYLISRAMEGFSVSESRKNWQEMNPNMKKRKM